MMYVESVIHSLLINGTQVGYIRTGRGLRQGDPLFPYLFIICTEGLISLLKGACARGELSEAQLIMRILKLYGKWSGQLVSVQKSTVLFSPNVDSQTQNQISGILGMPEVFTHGKYLGLPTNIGTSKKEVLKSVIDRINTKVANWNPRLLSKAGK
ncbi:hypothetical protein LIER_32353 [Lithospermum erythrorhizon]|uniref:Reverse transcriptase n=1 Tax=Lithospermum erythrorhizon TaxID=34254 RepID=A0AAV3RW16_LITER